MRLTSRVADRFGRRDWVENAAVKVYNALALMRGRKVGQGELLVLIPRCLSKETLDGVLGIAGQIRRARLRRHQRSAGPAGHSGTPAAGRGSGGLRARHGERVARRGGKIPVLGLTMTLPSGPCKDAAVNLGQLEEWVRAYVV